MPEHAEARAQTNAHSAAHDHVVPVSTYVLVFLALLVGTGVTVGASYVDLGMWNTPVAMLIAITKASLVVFFFMHLKYSPRLLWVWLGAALCFLGLLIIGVETDYFARIFLNLGNPGT
jgi:cytochrome c oxidase subunit 4